MELELELEVENKLISHPYEQALALLISYYEEIWRPIAPILFCQP
jgi:hypothetical protein